MRRPMLAVLAVLVVGSGLVLAAALNADSNGKTIVYNFEGKSSLRRDRSALALDLDMPCQNNDVFVTREDGQIDLSFNGVLGMRMGSSAECLLLNTNASNVRLKAAKGFYQFNMRPIGTNNSFEFETPTTVIRVNDNLGTTQFSIDSGTGTDAKTGKKATTKIVVKRGSVDVFVKISSATMKILEDQALEVGDETFIPAQRAASEEELTPLERISSVYIVPLGRSSSASLNED